MVLRKQRLNVRKKSAQKKYKEEIFLLMKGKRGVNRLFLRWEVRRVG